MGREHTSYIYAPFCTVCGKRLDPAAAEEALAAALRSGDGQRIFDAMMDLREATGGGDAYALPSKFLRSCIPESVSHRRLAGVYPNRHCRLWADSDLFRRQIKALR